MCVGDDHLAWKHLVSSEACKGLCTAGGYDRFYQGSFKVHPYPFKATLTLQVEPYILQLGLPPYMWVHLRAFRASLVIVWIQYSLFQSPVESAQRSVRVRVTVEQSIYTLTPCSFQFRLSFLSCFSYIVPLFHFSCSRIDILFSVWICHLRSEQRGDQFSFQRDQTWISRLSQSISLRPP